MEASILIKICHVFHKLSWTINWTQRSSRFKIARRRHVQNLVIISSIISSYKQKFKEREKFRYDMTRCGRHIEILIKIRNVFRGLSWIIDSFSILYLALFFFFQEKKGPIILVSISSNDSSHNWSCIRERRIQNSLFKY